jgi:hypothetical protein
MARPGDEFQGAGGTNRHLLHDYLDACGCAAGRSFLYSLSRLNVATSRAKCLSILVCSPALFEPECRTPEQMKMTNAFCRYLEMTKRVCENNRL